MPTVQRTYLARSGPRRREYQRARYLATTLVARPALPPPAPQPCLSTATELAQLHTGYAANPTTTTAHCFLTAVLAAGAALAAHADELTEPLFGAADCNRPTVAADAVTAARRRFTEQQARWLQVDRQVRHQFNLPTDTELSETQLFPPELPAAHQRWRRAARADYEYARTEFLDLTAQSAGHDPGWETRTRLRRRVYLQLVGPTTTTTGDDDLPIPTRWLQASPTTSTAEAALSDAYTHRPALKASVDVFVSARHHSRVAAPFAVTPATALSDGARALFAGSHGGLIGDGYRTNDPQLRALILTAWTYL